MTKGSSLWLEPPARSSKKARPQVMPPWQSLSLVQPAFPLSGLLASAPGRALPVCWFIHRQHLLSISTLPETLYGDLPQTLTIPKMGKLSSQSLRDWRVVQNRMIKTGLELDPPDLKDHSLRNTK